ncbi:hypothetical protein C1192_15700 [Escherichia marmotae]|nr:hypothetical protein C1192_15700 [Escherichia marmotae]
MPPGIKPPQHCASPEPSGLPLILRQRICPEISQFFTLCCAFRRILSACSRCIFLTKKAAEFYPCGLARAQIAITAADARMACYFRLFSQLTIRLARMPAMTGAAKSCQKAMPNCASVI